MIRSRGKQEDSRRGGRRSEACPNGESGMTLVELLVAIIIIGIVFAGVGTFLINSARAALTNERRVQSTALLNQINEELQAMPWDRAGLYASEMQDESDTMLDLGIDPSLSPPEFEGEPVVVLEFPCDEADPDCERDEFVPEPVRTITVDDREYTVVTIVTRASDVGDGVTSLRFTLIAEWEVFNRPIQQRLQSVRSPTASELEEFGLPTPVFNISPTSVGLGADGMTITPIEVYGDFTGPVDEVEVEYSQVDSDGDPVGPSGEVTLTKVDGAPDGIAWEGEIPAEIGPYVPGVLDLKMTASVGVDHIVTERSVQLVEEDELSGEPTVTEVTQDRLQVSVGNAGQSRDKLCQTLTVTAKVENLDEESGTVTATFQGDGGTGLSMTPDANGIDPDGVTTLHLVFEAGSDSPWDPQAGQGAAQPAQDVDVQFTVQASNGLEGGNTETSSWITVTREQGQC